MRRHPLIRRIVICHALAVAALAGVPAAAAPQAPAAAAGRESPAEDRAHLAAIQEYLGPDGVMKPFRATFTGERIPIPAELELPLAANFERWRFTLVRMRIGFDISSRLAVLVLLTDAKSGRVVGHTWELGMDQPSEGFRRLMRGETSRSDEYATGKVATLAMLLLSTLEGHRGILKPRIGEATWSRTAIRVELSGAYVPFRILEVPYDSENGFGDLDVRHPTTAVHAP